MMAFWCKGKKDYCDKGNCDNCEFEDGSGGFELGEDEEGIFINQWISVKDRLPGESGYYLYFADNPYKGLQDGIGVSYFMHKAKEWKKVYTPCVTHWMPLPEPPEEGSHDL